MTDPADERGRDWWTLDELLEPWRQRIPSDATERAETGEDAEHRQNPG